MSLIIAQSYVRMVSYLTLFTDLEFKFSQTPEQSFDMRLLKRCQSNIKLWYDLTLKDHCSVDCGTFHIVLRERRPQECVIVPRCAPTNL